MVLVPRTTAPHGRFALLVRMSALGQGQALPLAAGKVGKGSRPCENVREPRKRRTVFSIAFFEQPSPELLVFRLTKSRRTFYAQVERGSFRTGSVGTGNSAVHWAGCIAAH